MTGLSGDNGKEAGDISDVEDVPIHRASTPQTAGVHGQFHNQTPGILGQEAVIHRFHSTC